MGLIRGGDQVAVMTLGIMLVVVWSVVADSDKDKEECAEQLVGLATCLPYVGGNAKAPTADCCSGLKQVLKANRKCLCVVIKDRNDPDLGLNINVTLALALPSVCHAQANVSECPALLKLPPNSPDAQVFYQFGNHTAISPAPAPGAVSVGSSSSNSPSSKASGEQKSSGCCSTCIINKWILGIFMALVLCSTVSTKKDIIINY